MSRRLTLKSNLIKQDVLKDFHVAISVLASFEFATACHEIKVSSIRSKRIVFLKDLLGKPLHFAERLFNSLIKLLDFVLL